MKPYNNKLIRYLNNKSRVFNRRHKIISNKLRRFKIVMKSKCWQCKRK